MLIRPATTRDASDIASGERAVAATPRLLNGAPGEISLSAYINKIRSLSKRPNGLYVVAQDGAQILGHLLLDPLTLAANAHICTLTVVVYPPWQNAGIGTQLMQHATQWAQTNSCVEKIELLVRSSNDRALALYRSMGFHEEGRIGKRLKLADGYEDDIAMALFV